MMPTSTTLPRRCRTWRDLFRDRSGIAATEFAFIAPVMLLAFFGTVEICTGVAVDRKIKLVARTLTDLTSQTAAASNVGTIVDSDLQNIFTASVSIMAPYDASPTKTILSEIYVDSTGVATIKWSKAAVIASGASQATLTTSSRNSGDNVTSIVPSSLLVKTTYLILSEVSYQYVPAVPYVMSSSGIKLSDSSYTRPRQALCIVYNNQPPLNNGACPQQ